MLYITIVGKFYAWLVANNTQLSSENCHICILNYLRSSYMYIAYMTKSSDMLNKNTSGAKKGEANQKQQLSDYTCD